MCKLKSAIILKDRIFIPEYDSHSQMLEELHIADDYLGASKKFVRAELSPMDNDVFSDIDSWEFVVDQDITPGWFLEEEYKPKMVEAVKEWAKTHIHIGIDGLKINAGQNHYIKDCKDVEICGSATVKYICGSATVKYICDSATVENICDSATVKYICGSATVKYICDSATVKYICDSATVENIRDSATVENIRGSATVENIRDSATVISSPYSKWRNAESLIISDNATFKDSYGKVIYQSGNYQLISVESGKTIKEMAK